MAAMDQKLVLGGAEIVVESSQGRPHPPILLAHDALVLFKVEARHSQQLIHGH